MYMMTPRDHMSHDLSYFSGPRTSGAETTKRNTRWTTCLHGDRDYLLAYQNHCPTCILKSLTYLHSYSFVTWVIIWQCHYLVTVLPLAMAEYHIYTGERSLQAYVVFRLIRLDGGVYEDEMPPRGLGDPIFYRIMDYRQRMEWRKKPNGGRIIVG